MFQNEKFINENFNLFPNNFLRIPEMINSVFSLVEVATLKINPIDC